MRGSGRRRALGLVSITVVLMILTGGWPRAALSAPPSTTSTRAATGAAAAGAAASAPPGPPILNENAYWRIFFRMGFLRLSPKVMVAEGESLLEKRDLANLERMTKTLLAPRNIDWSARDWRELACVFWGGGQGGQFAPEAAALRPEAAPPPNWSAFDFDDQAWMTRNFVTIPMQALRPHYIVESSYQHIQGICLRGYFELPPPAQAGELTLKLTYRGGARVLLNGKELARGHLPKGELPSDVLADEYPKEAYLTADGTNFIGDHLFIDPAAFPPAELQRVSALRDRVIGPIVLDARDLRQGRNVLAIELRTSPYHPIILPGAGGFDKKGDQWYRNWHRNDRNLPTWEHVRLVAIELRSSTGGAPSALTRPEQPRVWVDDMHRRFYSPDYCPRGLPTGAIRLVAARNGSFSAQLGLASGAEPLRSPRAQASELKHQGAGAAIPASAVEIAYEVGYLHHIDNLYLLGGGKGRGGASNTMAAQQDIIGRNYARHGADRKKLTYFDHLSAEPPAVVPANSLQPLWVRLQVPEKAEPGRYAGAVTVSAENMPPATVPVEVEVIDWRLPSPLEFQTRVQSEQSPYGVAKHYKVPLWSDEHFRLMDASFRQLARLGSDYIFIPVIHNSEFGNKRDSPVRWIRRKDGKLDFDYAVMDRYLELAMKHLGKPRVICFVIMMMGGQDTPPVEIAVHDETTGKDEIVDVGPAVSGFKSQGKVATGPAALEHDAKRFALWEAFARSLVTHMKQKGLLESTYWGYKWDIPDDRGLMQFMEKAAPNVYWASGGHNAQIDRYFHAVSRVYGTDVGPASKLGWKTPFDSYTVKYGLALNHTAKDEVLSDEQKKAGTFLNLLMPRCLGSVITVDGSSTPFAYRVLADRALHAGFGGIARMGADYFDYAWFAGCKNNDYLGVGRQCTMTLWPGKNGAESSARNEAMLEGIQEAEARIFLEQARDPNRDASRLGTPIDRGLLPPAKAAEIQKLLNEHMASTVYLRAVDTCVDLGDYAGLWQDRSRKLFTAAAEVARMTQKP